MPLPQAKRKAKLARKLRCRIGIGTASNFRDKKSVRLKRVLGSFSYSIETFNCRPNTFAIFSNVESRTSSA